MTDDELIVKSMERTPDFLNHLEYDRLIALAKRGAAVMELARAAYNEGFNEGGREYTTSRGGNVFGESKIFKRLSALGEPPG